MIRAACPVIGGPWENSFCNPDFWWEPSLLPTILFQQTASVSKRFDVDAVVTLASFIRTLCRDVAIGEEGGTSAVKPPVHPAGAIWAACRIGSEGPVEELLFGQRAQGADPTIDYVLTLRPTVSNYEEDHAAFVQWLRGVRFSRIR